MLYKSDNLFASLRLPIYKFRPSQADGLQLDIWNKGVNLMMDTGTYSYADLDAVNQFSGTRCHNTICFDRRDQMPRLGRFLFAKWLKGNGEINTQENLFSGSYCDNWGSKHTRKVIFEQNTITVIDQVSGFSKQAELSWHLAPFDWKIEQNEISYKDIKVRFECDKEFDLKLDTAPRSLFYLSKDEVPVSRLLVKSSCEIKTIITLSSDKAL